jgi:hypothetical protein
MSFTSNWTNPLKQRRRVSNIDVSSGSSDGSIALKGHRRKFTKIRGNDLMSVFKEVGYDFDSSRAYSVA